MTPNLGKLWHGNLLPTSQDLGPTLEPGFDGPSDVGAVIRSTVYEGHLGCRIDGEGEDEGAVFLLRKGEGQGLYGMIMVQDIKGTNCQSNSPRSAKTAENEHYSPGRKRGGTDLAGKHHPSKVLHVTRRLDVDDRYVLVLGVGEDLGLGGRKIIGQDRTG